MVSETDRGQGPSVFLGTHEDIRRRRTRLFYGGNGFLSLLLSKKYRRIFSDIVVRQIFPSMFDDYANLRPLKGVAEILANDDTWEPLYDLKQLSKNEVKVSAVTQVFYP